jgi:putative ABC transport system ATP-binding protein
MSEPEVAVTAERQATTRVPLVSIRDLTKHYVRGDQIIPVLVGINLDIRAGDYVALMGPSGSGKSTLLNLIAGIDKPTSGSIHVAGVDIAQLAESELAAWRAAHVGFIFQFYNLMPVLSAYDNVELPLLLTPLSRRDRRERVETALALVGLSDRRDHYPNELSGGQQQRVAIARALIGDPTLIVADEPTGDLDRATAEEILHLLARLNEEVGKTIVMVTHDPKAAEKAHRVIQLEKGVLVTSDRLRSPLSGGSTSNRNGCCAGREDAGSGGIGLRAEAAAFAFVRPSSLPAATKSSSMSTSGGASSTCSNSRMSE